jgi:hypothetical protein
MAEDPLDPEDCLRSLAAEALLWAPHRPLFPESLGLMAVVNAFVMLGLLPEPRVFASLIAPVTESRGDPLDGLDQRSAQQPRTLLARGLPGQRAACESWWAYDSVRHLGQLRRGCQDLARSRPAGRRGCRGPDRHPAAAAVQITQPGPACRAAIMVTWAISIAALLVCATIYSRQVIHDVRASGLSTPALRLTILPVTLTAAAILFAIIISRRSPDLPTRLASAAIGAIAAPMIFELPFDPIVIFRIRTVLPDPPPWSLVYVPCS